MNPSSRGGIFLRKALMRRNTDVAKRRRWYCGARPGPRPAGRMSAPRRNEARESHGPACWSVVKYPGGICRAFEPQAFPGNRMTNNSDRSAYAYACVVGPIVWIATSLLTQRQEAWDSPLYWAFAYPVLAMAVALITLKVPRRPWRWALVIMLAQAPVLFASNPSGNLLPLGILAFAL